MAGMKKPAEAGRFSHQNQSNILSVAIQALAIILNLRSASYAPVDGFRLLLCHQAVQGRFTHARVSL
jgi:hypothetical protein